MASNLKPGWCEEAGRLAGEAERGENLKPMAPGRHYIPVLPQPKPDQIQRVKAACKRRHNERKLDRKLDQALGRVGND